MSRRPVRRDASGSGLQDRAWEPPQLSWRGRLLWAWFFLYVTVLVVLARHVRHGIRGWWGVAAMAACLALGMSVWRRSLPSRIARISTLVGRWGLRLAYWLLFAPWALLVKRRDPLRLRSHSDSSWTERPARVVTLADARQQY